MAAGAVVLLVVVAVVLLVVVAVRKTKPPVTVTVIKLIREPFRLVTRLPELIQKLKGFGW